eukprot:11163596-Lingulodinium_polyedra.AAC.1
MSSFPAFAVYQDKRNSRWQCFHKCFGTVSRSWALHGPFEALRMVLAWSWDQAIEAGIVTECPFEELKNCDWQKA